MYRQGLGPRQDQSLRFVLEPSGIRWLGLCFSSWLVVGKVDLLRQLHFQRLRGYQWKVSKKELYPRVLRSSRGRSRDLGAQTIVYLVES